MAHDYAVYIMANRRRGTLYIGVTSDLLSRVSEHRDGTIPGFTKRYGCKHLVWFGEFGDIRDAIDHEKRLKKWSRAWKDELIETENPNWRDLWWDLIGPQPKGPWPPNH
nr:GIY-YIG nuclease family protein [uncultured Devosia sp.]